jgi:hypothetical protein
MPDAVEHRLQPADSEGSGAGKSDRCAKNTEIEFGVHMRCQPPAGPQ